MRIDINFLLSSCGGALIMLSFFSADYSALRDALIGMFFIWFATREIYK